jgi:diguanylate cyclase (GGDEF)-like protein/PAS domain S-box-containing protein
MGGAPAVRGWTTRGWALLLSLIILTAIARSGIAYLHHSAEQHLREESLLLTIDGVVHRLRNLEGNVWLPEQTAASAGEREWDEERAADVADAQAELERVLTEFDRIDAGIAGEIRAAGSRFVDAVTELDRLVRSGATTEAVAWDEQHVDPSFAAWDALVEGEAASHRAAATHAARQADAGTAITLVAAALVGFFVFRHVERVRRTSALLAGERRAETKFRTLVEQLPAITYIQLDDGAGTTIYASPQTESISGWPTQTFVDNPTHWIDIVHPDDREGLQAANRHADKTGEPFRYEYRQRKPNGEYIWIRDEAVRVEDPAGGPPFWLGVITDVTAQHEREAALRAAESRFRTLVEQLPAVVYVEDLDAAEAGGISTHSYNSPRVETLYGYDRDEWQRTPGLWVQSLHPDDRERVLVEDARTETTGEPFQAEYRVIARDGRVVWIRDEAVLIRDEDGRPLYWQGVQFDVTELKEAQQALLASEQQFRLLFAANPHPMWLYDRETLRFLEVNDAAVAHYGYSRDEFLAMTIADIRPPDDVPALLTSLDHERPDLLDNRGWRHLTKDGRLIDVEITSHVLKVRNRDAVLAVAQDVTARLVLERRLEHQAFHDSLTALPNRSLFRDRLGHALDRTKRHPGMVAVLFLDLDDFKVVNDTLGHEAGDRLLVAVSERLRRVLRPEDTLARLGGDEFTVLLEDLPDAAEARRVAERLAAVLRPSFQLDGRDVLVSASLGIAVQSNADEGPDDLLRLADVAMYEAKHGGKDRFAVFDTGMDARAWQRLNLEAELRRAIDEGQLRLHYQPLVDLATKRVVEVEALVRWQHPEHGLVPPSDFIPLAEETGLIVPLDRWVLDEAWRDAAGWARSDPAAAAIGVAVNLSARQFRHAGLVDDVALALAKSGLDPARLKLEITETAAMEDAMATAAALRALKELGVRLAIDDFGAGYSGLSYLRSCPVDVLGIDRAYVAGLGRDAADAALVRAVVAFARTLGLGVTAEGVETEAQLAALRALGCDYGQGILFAHPLPGADVLRFLDDASTIAPAGLVAARAAD